jgi:hypothetical protein
MIFPCPKRVNVFHGLPTGVWETADITSHYARGMEKGIENTLRIVLK